MQQHVATVQNIVHVTSVTAGVRQGVVHDSSYLSLKKLAFGICLALTATRNDDYFEGTVFNLISGDCPQGFKSGYEGVSVIKSLHLHLTKRGQIQAVWVPLSERL